MALDRRGNLKVECIVFVRPLDEPSPCWCEEHGLPCLLVQHFAVTMMLNGGPEEIVEIVRGEGHR